MSIRLKEIVAYSTYTGSHLYVRCVSARRRIFKARQDRRVGREPRPRYVGGTTINIWPCSILYPLSEGLSLEGSVIMKTGDQIEFYSREKDWVSLLV
jgi:hypothetical protein